MTLRMGDLIGLGLFVLAVVALLVSWTLCAVVFAVLGFACIASVQWILSSERWQHLR